MSLTNAEKLQAISSPWADYITHLEKTHLTIDGGLIDKISFDDSRGRAFQNIAQLVYCCAGLPATQRIPTAAKLEKWLTSQDERPSAAFTYAMADVLGRLWELAGSEELDAPFRKFKAKVAPVEFVYIGALTHFPPARHPILKENNSFFFGSSTGILLYILRNGYSPAEQSHTPYTSSDATSVKPTSTCDSTRAWPPIAGPSLTQSRMAKYTSRSRTPLRAGPRPTGSVNLLVPSRHRRMRRLVR